MVVGNFDGEYFWIYWPTGCLWFPGINPIEYAKICSTFYMKVWTPKGKTFYRTPGELIGCRNVYDDTWVQYFPWVLRTYGIISGWCPEYGYWESRWRGVRCYWSQFYGPSADSLPLNKLIWKPPEGWVGYRLPKHEESLLKLGTKAPDFDLTLINKDRFTLSDYHGKIVWLFFWRVECQPCCQELPHLE